MKLLPQLSLSKALAWLGHELQQGVVPPLPSSSGASGYLLSAAGWEAWMAASPP